MEKETAFKFQPVWIAFMTLFAFLLLYKFYVLAISETIFNYSFWILAILPCLVSWFVLPMTAKAIGGVSAIVLTKDYLVDNMGNNSIEWGDISEIRLVEGQYRSFEKLIINLKQPEKYFDTPIKKALYKFRQLFTANDIAIILDFVSGKDDEITQLVHVYWDKHAGL